MVFKELKLYDVFVVPIGILCKVNDGYAIVLEAHKNNLGEIVWLSPNEPVTLRNNCNDR